jgi:hypothetical protein
MQKLTKEQLEAVELCMIEEKAECWKCPANNVDCQRSVVMTAAVLMAENEALKEALKKD